MAGGNDPKLSRHQWAAVRRRWESEEDPGFHWIVKAMKLPVSATAVRKHAVKEGWKKDPIKITERAAKRVAAEAAKPPRGPMPKGFEDVYGEKLEQETSKMDHEAGLEALHKFGTIKGLTAKQELFVREYVTDFNGPKAALRSGYSEESAAQISRQLLRNPKVDGAIAAYMRERVKRMGREADELVRFHLAIIEFDPNEICEHRIHACRYCWGPGHAFQHSPSTWAEERRKFQKRWEKLSETERKVLGEFPEVPPDGWYEAKRGPNEDCPECHGVGVPVVKWKDTRFLSPVGKLLFSGVKEGKDGMEIVTLQKQASLSILSTHLGLTKPVERQVNVAVVTETARSYYEIMEEARERNRRVLVERGILAAGSGETVDG